MKMKKTALATALAATLLLTPSCQGPNKLFTGVNEWNADLTEQDWLNTAVFWGLHIIPVYEISYLVDVLVVNTIDYWSADGE